MMVIGLILFIWLGIRRIMTQIGVLTSPWFQIGVMMFLLGFIAILMGLIAELLMRTYFESQKKKTYTIREVVEPIGKKLPELIEG